MIGCRDMATTVAHCVSVPAPRGGRCACGLAKPIPLPLLEGQGAPTPVTSFPCVQSPLEDVRLGAATHSVGPSDRLKTNQGQSGGPGWPWPHWLDATTLIANYFRIYWARTLFFLKLGDFSAGGEILIATVKKRKSMKERKETPHWFCCPYFASLRLFRAGNSLHPLF